MPISDASSAIELDPTKLPHLAIPSQYNWPNSSRMVVKDLDAPLVRLLSGGMAAVKHLKPEDGNSESPFARPHLNSLRRPVARMRLPFCLLLWRSTSSPLKALKPGPGCTTPFESSA
jgi:hypothetical protein